MYKLIFPGGVQKIEGFAFNLFGPNLFVNLIGSTACGSFILIERLFDEKIKKYRARSNTAVSLGYL